MLTINMVGTGLCTALLPMMLQSTRPVLLTWFTLTVSGECLAPTCMHRPGCSSERLTIRVIGVVYVGMFQGSLIPAHQDLKRDRKSVV